MSQAPWAVENQEAENQYLDAWNTTMRLLRQGHSFSGRERNCAFLNCQGQRFANVSSLTGLDFDDDGRALAVTDWDHDGDLDIWLHNRNGPRLRLMRNGSVTERESSAAGRFVALRLRGTRSNRDAIGARAELHFDSTSQAPLVRTLSAGDGYLSQSSKWLFFGLAGQSDVSELRVRWPNGTWETFSDIRPGDRYHVTEGSGRAVAQMSVRSMARWSSRDQDIPDRSQTARVFLANRLPLPLLPYTTTDGRQHDTGDLQRPTLICLWASTCARCASELREMTAGENRLREAGAQVLALSVDGLHEEEPIPPEASERLLETIGFPFRSGQATARLLDKLEIVQRIILNRQPSFAVPTSVLVDQHGEVATYYRGPIGMDRLMEDIGQLNVPSEQRRDLAIPMGGRWGSGHRQLLLRPVAVVFRERGYQDDYARYLRLEARRLERQSQQATNEAERSRLREQFAASHFNLAHLMQTEGRHGEAIEHCRAGLQVKPDDARARYMLGRALQSQTRPRQAADAFRHALRLDPNLVVAHTQLGKLLLASRHHQEAALHFRKALSERPELVEPRFQLGLAMVRQGLLSDAKSQFTLVTERQPGHVESWVNLGVVHARLRKTDLAITALQQALRLQPAHTTARLNLGTAYAQGGNFAQAVAQFEAVLKDHPDHVLARRSLGQACLEIRDYIAAEKHLQRVVAAKPDDYRSALQLAWLLSTCPQAQARDGQRALELIEPIHRRTDGRDARVLDMLAAAHAEMRQWKRAVQLVTEALRVLGSRNESLRSTMETRVGRYQRREPYRDDDGKYP